MEVIKKTVIKNGLEAALEEINSARSPQEKIMLLQKHGLMDPILTPEEVELCSLS
jgi:hypothetical protein